MEAGEGRPGARTGEGRSEARTGEKRSEAGTEGEISSVPRFLPSRLDAPERRIYGGVALFFLLVFVALVWPVYPRFAGIRPLVLGMPFSLFYVVVLLVCAFLVLLGLYLWEGTRRSGGVRDRSGERVREGRGAQTGRDPTPPDDPEGG